MQQPSVPPILSLFSSNRKRIILLIQLGYIVFSFVLILGIYLIATKHSLSPLVLEFGSLLAKGAVITFLLSTIPGIAGRFEIKNPIITIGIMFRRHIGITTYLLAMGHSLLSYWAPSLTYNVLSFPPALFVLFGSMALNILFCLFLTSNDWSVKKMGKWWKRLHRLVYIVFWLIALHTGWQGELTWSFGVGMVGALEIVSLVYDYMKKRGVKTSQEVTER